jgi:hypothetical protein
MPVLCARALRHHCRRLIRRAQILWHNTIAVHRQIALNCLPWFVPEILWFDPALP